MTTTRFLVMSLFASVLIAVPGEAQDKPKPPEAPTPSTPEGPKPAAPTRGSRPAVLRVQVVLTRSQGERRISSMPYTFLVTTDPSPQLAKPSPQRARVQMGVEVPVTVTQLPQGEGKTAPVTSFQYRNVGTNINCSAQTLGDGFYQLVLVVENSSVYQGPESRSPGAAPDVPVGTGDRPLFRSFSVDLNPVLRDGESVQTVASTDPVSGEVVKIDVSINVLK